MAALDLEPSGAQAPHERCLRSGCDHGQAGDAPCRAVVVGDGGQRVSGDVQCPGAFAGRREPVRAEPSGERSQVGCERRDERRLAVERPAAAHELQHPGRTVARRAGRSSVSTSPSKRAATSVAAVSTDSVRRPSSSAASEPGGGPDRTRDQRPGAVREPDGRQLCPRAACCRLDELGEDRLQHGSPREQAAPRENAASATDRSVRVSITA